MKILALVPARGGSKRLPGKNIRPLASKPLIAWTIDAARACPGIDAVVVSTDDPAIAEVARQAGAVVPGLRPPALATDEASSVDVALHAVDEWEKSHGPVDGLLLLQPTSPFRRTETIARGLAAFESGGRLPVVSVSPAPSHPAWCFRIDGGRLQPFLPRESMAVRSQDLEPAYALNGALYLISPETLRREKTFLPRDVQPLLMDDPAEALDIDTAWDWQMAEALLPAIQARGVEK